MSADRASRAPVPVVLAPVAGLVGLVLLLAGWVGTSGRTTLSGQLGFVSLAVAGLVVAGAGALLHLSALGSRLSERTRRFERACAAWIGEQAR